MIEIPRHDRGLRVLAQLLREAAENRVAAKSERPRLVSAAVQEVAVDGSDRTS